MFHLLRSLLVCGLVATFLRSEQFFDRGFRVMAILTALSLLLVCYLLLSVGRNESGATVGHGGAARLAHSDHSLCQ